MDVEQYNDISEKIAGNAMKALADGSRDARPDRFWSLPLLLAAIWMSRSGHSSGAILSQRTHAVIDKSHCMHTCCKQVFIFEEHIARAGKI